MTVRPANETDAAAIADIWNRYIDGSLATFTSELKTSRAIAERIECASDAGHSFFVVETETGIEGFACTGDFRNGPGYAHSLETTIYLAEGAQGKGLGRALMARLEDDAAGAGVHLLVAGISAANPAGLAFHRSCGYLEGGVLPEAGRKYGKWLDLHLLFKHLDQP